MQDEIRLGFTAFGAWSCRDLPSISPFGLSSRKVL